MKKKERHTIHTMTVGELQKRAHDLSEQLAEWGLNRYTKQSKNVRAGRALRQIRATVLTVLRQKELAHE